MFPHMFFRRGGDRKCMVGYDLPIVSKYLERFSGRCYTTLPYILNRMSSSRSDS
jgi:hypothetical protein